MDGITLSWKMPFLNALSITLQGLLNLVVRSLELIAPILRMPAQSGAQYFLVNKSMAILLACLAVVGLAVKLLALATFQPLVRPIMQPPASKFRPEMASTLQ